MTYVLGVSAFYHDSAAALLRDGEILAAAQEERFTRRKGDPSLPIHATAYCLEAAGIRIQDVDLLGFYDKPLLKFERLLETYLAIAPRGFSSFVRAGPLWAKERLFIGRQLREGLEYDGEILFAEHHESHAASAFFPSPFEEAAILTMDGVGEWATASVGVGRENDLTIAREMHWPDSLGLLYSAFTSYTGFEVNSGEYKVMGLAPYGHPKYVATILDELMDLRGDGSFRLNQAYFNYVGGLTMTSERFHDLFGGHPREHDGPITQREMDLARSVQDVCEEVVLRMAATAHRETGLDALCMSGGVALNCVANGRVLREGPFSKIWMQPAAGDAGGAIGVAHLIWFRHLQNPRRLSSQDSMSGSYLGPSFTDDEIDSTLDRVGAVARRLEREDLVASAARLLADQKVVGWFQGRMEFGPRALGSRSILGDPRSPTIQALINEKVKFRETFRPFGPSVLEGRASDYFELSTTSPYMMLVAQVREGQRRPHVKLPAVTHVDGSARIHTVSHQRNPDFFDLIVQFDALTGCPVVLNTSFNVRGEPIVCTPDDAYDCFMRTDMDALVMGSYLLRKEEQPKPPPPSKRTPEILASLTRSENRRFALSIGLAFLGLGGVLWWAGRPVPMSVAFVAGTALFVAGLVVPGRVGPVYRIWMQLALAVSKVTTPLLMGVVYFLVLVPTGMLQRAVGRNAIRHSAQGGSYWKLRASEVRSDLRRQF